MYELDSRALGPVDCYGQRFMRPGEFPYDVVPAGLSRSLRGSVLSVQADGAAAEGTMNQHTVLISADRERSLTVNSHRLPVQVGDMVLWHGPRLRRPYEIIGDQEFFSSRRLTNECGYSHAFGLPGEYRWRDAHGSGIGGTVIVENGDNSTERGRSNWQDQLRQGVLVIVNEKGADPAEVRILTGQTVFFIVIQAPGISITDERLLG
jgi:plastocyanin